jgi:S-adenosylmethionine:tRNA ribosyltransferase-isomerase
MPLPPYIDRSGGPAERDLERYQTVYAASDGAAAAPTAGLHFTSGLIDELTSFGVGFARLTLHVGAGTFQPVRCDLLSQHPMHAERFAVPESVANQITAAEGRGSRLIAVGTTSCRSLETWHRLSRPLDGLERQSRLFLHPGNPPQLTMSLLTNFHLPRSTLLMLVAAFLGRERTLQIYEQAQREGYRFYSYGDAMLIL